MSNHVVIEQIVPEETTCGSFLRELQTLWDDIGEPEALRDEMLVDIERQCLEIYRRKVDDAKKSKFRLQQAIADTRKEILEICHSLGEEPVVYLDQKPGGNLKEVLEGITPQLEEMHKKKLERRNQFVEVLTQIRTISDQISGSDESKHYKNVVDEHDLTLKKLEVLHRQLGELQMHKSNRLKEVEDKLNILHSLSVVLDLDFEDLICEVHPTLNGSKGMKDISNSTIENLATKIENLRLVKMQRVQKLQELAAALLELWDLMDTPMEEQQKFHIVTRKLATSESEITEPKLLSPSFIKDVEDEVSRMEKFKSGKMKELILKKKLELEDICRRTHMVNEDFFAMKQSAEAIESGSVDLMYLMEQIENQLVKVKKEAGSRKDILDKVEKWMAACEEESWLEEYNRDENRYNAGRGSHLMLRRAEKARVMLGKIPAMVETLISRVTIWEDERGTEFLYDGVRLLAMLEQYRSLLEEKEQEKLRQRDQKKLQGQFIVEQEVLYGSKPSPLKSKRILPSRPSTIGTASDRKLSIGGSMLQNSRPERSAQRLRPYMKSDSLKPIGYSGYQLSGGSAVKPSGRRDSMIPGHIPLKKKSSNVAKPCEMKSPQSRRPLSPVLSGSSIANIANSLDHKKRTENDTIQKTPPKANFNHGDEENRTPTKMQPFSVVPSTPKTISVPMLMAATPATPHSRLCAKTNENVMERVEYSFEEARAGFMICP
ncbi:hypothetical protein ACFE04_017668 [Oxalis oulophora]